MAKKAAKKTTKTVKPALQFPKTKAKARTKLPADTALPGMEQVRHTDLDGSCRRIAEIRTDKNQNIQQEKGELTAALDYMRKNDVRSYTRNGIELFRVEGEESLRVRLSKQKDGGE